MHALDLKHVFRLVNFSLERNLEGITHAHTLFQPEQAGNTINWLLGHLLQVRQYALQDALGEAILDPATLTMYDTKTAFDPEKALHLDELREKLDLSFAALNDAFDALTDEQLAEVMPKPFFNAPVTRGQQVNFYSFHEGYHIGQIALIRRLLGMSGQI